MEGQKYAQTMSQRPGSQPSKTPLFDTAGSGLKRNSKPVKPTRVMSDDDESEDELNSWPSTSQPRREDTSSALPETSDVIKTLKFKKKKPEDGTGAPTSKENAGVVDRKATGGDIDCTSEKATTRPLRDNPSHRNSSPESRSTQPAIRRTASQTENSKKRVPPTTTKSLQRKQSVDDDGDPGPSRSKRPPVGSTSTLSIPQLSPTTKTRIRPQPRKKDPMAEFPALSPLGKHGSRKGKERETEVASTSRRVKSKPDPAPFPILSPVRDTTPKKPPKKPTEFPAPSPLRINAEPGKTKKKPLEARPFPMDFESRPSPPKRGSSDIEFEQEPKKKRKRSQSRTPAIAHDQEDDSFFMAPNTDPKTLCPYCDGPLPPDPTPHLQSLLEQTLKKSRPDPRPANPLGRRAPMAAFIGVCQRHRFETEILPEAEEKGWPKTIDWEDVRSRVQAMEWQLRQIVNNTGDDDESAPESSQAIRGARRQCLFWRDMIKEIKAKGSKGVQGVQEQFANFHKTQPGYYGEMGSVIIHQALYDMFPLTAIEPQLVNPLTPHEFIQRILVPEVGMRLVIQDRNLDAENKADRKCAVAILRASATYGVAMFPDESGQTAGDDVGEQLIMERAMRRRLELEAEEREEEEMAKRVAQKSKRSGKRKAKTKDSEPEDLPVERPRPRPKPKPKKPQQNLRTDSSGMDSDSAVDNPPTTKSNFSTGSNITPRRSRSRSRIRYLSQSSDDHLPCDEAPTTLKKRFKSVVSISDSDSTRPRQTRSGATSRVASDVADMVISSSEEADSDVAVLGARTKVETKSRKKTQATLAMDEQDQEATPRPAARTSKILLSSSSSASHGEFRPLDAARNRAKTTATDHGQSSPRKNSTDGWIRTMAVEPHYDDDDDDNIRPPQGSQSSSSWLLEA
ncbi:RTC4 domain-containing protein [Mycena indigotica]|uniref:Restriction of telomere capping protein 4 n=1 Tax=Mycena indigotica TaxID=2126181 RepID=A0A8H6WDV6_9AGAR|nr:RTC4 domain-containing protein [Mycena indigotica]KAF7315074.1 RTC4 domain-containing protein [Mycena indigotica]